MERKLEICCGDIASVEAAIAGGADRIELCSALGEGGLTPSRGLIKMARQVASGAKLHVLIRPREGDFIYDAAETRCMVDDIRCARECGADGVVIGALTCSGEIDTKLCSKLMAEAGQMSVTFHRAFDRCRDAEKGLEEVIALGCDRVLTSGQAESAREGIEMLTRLNTQAAGRIIILAGAGINSTNAREILEGSGIHELHASARLAVRAIQAAEPAVKMGSNDSGMRMVTSTESVRELKKILSNEKNSKFHN